jgi:hypothetical protein
VKDNFVYARVAKFIGSRTTLDESKLEVCMCVCMRTCPTCPGWCAWWGSFSVLGACGGWGVAWFVRAPLIVTTWHCSVCLREVCCRATLLSTSSPGVGYCAAHPGICMCFSCGSYQALTEITMDDAVSRQILEAAKTSMGMDTSEIDMLNIDAFAARYGCVRVAHRPLGTPIRPLMQRPHITNPSFAQHNTL